MRLLALLHKEKALVVGTSSEYCIVQHCSTFISKLSHSTELTSPGQVLETVPMAATPAKLQRITCMDSCRNHADCGGFR